jgi:hypothetical protein
MAISNGTEGEKRKLRIENSTQEQKCVYAGVFILEIQFPFYENKLFSLF